MIADWLQPTITLFPLAAWIFLGVGLPWALALLPRGLWRERSTVIAVALALGPLGTTAVMFGLGLAGALRLGPTLAGSALLAALGAGLALRRRGAPFTAASEVGAGRRLSAGEIALLAGIVLVLLLNVITAAYWPFLAYDPLWVYAYNAKLFVLQERIPSSLGYYPPLLSLGYTTFQQAWGGLNDHAARVIVPWFNAAAVLMVYTLGRRAFGSRRVGLLAAALWTLYPHVIAWSGAGDLEIPLTLYLSGAAAFFIEAWHTDSRRAAVVSGVLLGGALWTKPTGGALALGIGLAILGWALIVRGRRAALWPKARLALIAGLASVPLGAAWYVRNALLGHTPVVFPPGYWHSLAQRSGQEFGWPLLIAALALGGLLVRAPDRLRTWPRRARIGLPLLALGLLLAGILPTALNLRLITQGDNLWRWLRGDLGAAGRLHAGAWLLIAAGFALLAALGREAWRSWSAARRQTVLLIWALLLPYAVVWFLDFSYHYRLSFAIVPLFAVQAAALLDGWAWDWLAARRARRAVGGALIAAAIALALAVGLEFSVKAWQKGLPDDRAKYDEGNPALMAVVHMLEDYAASHDRPPVVVIPGEDRLPFFFPTWEIRNSRALDELPTTVEGLGNADIFIDSSVNVYLLQLAHRWPNSLIAEANVGATYHDLKAQNAVGQPWPTVLQPIPLNPDGSLAADDGIFRYRAFSVHPEARFTLADPVVRYDPPVIIGGFAQLTGYSIVSLEWYPGDRITLSLYWEPTDEAPPPQDYSIYLHLLDANGEKIAQWDGEPLQGQYPTRYWQPGETLLDYWVLTVPRGLPPGPAQLRLGIYEPVESRRLPVEIGGEAAGDGITLLKNITLH